MNVTRLIMHHPFPLSPLIEPSVINFYVCINTYEILQTALKHLTTILSSRNTSNGWESRRKSVGSSIDLPVLGHCHGWRESLGIITRSLTRLRFVCLLSAWQCSYVIPAPHVKPVCLGRSGLFPYAICQSCGSRRDLCKSSCFAQTRVRVMSSYFM